MGRQLFLHHYLPSHLASSLVTGALLEFIFFAEPNPAEYGSKESEPKSPTSPTSPTSPKSPKRKAFAPIEPEELITAGTRLENQNMLPIWAASGVIVSAVIYGWYFFSPLTYGQPGLDVKGVLARKWLPYDLHFAK